MIPQALHILRKDIRRLRWELLACVASTLLLGWFNGDNTIFILPWGQQFDFRLTRLLPVLFGAALAARWFLVVSLIHGEVIPGMRQFWLTRPYRRTALLCAKLAFIALFLQVPVFLADILTLARAGVGPSGQWGAILWRQFLHFAMIIMPAIAIALVTTNLAQVALTAVGFILLSSVFTVVTPMGTHGLVNSAGLGWWSWIVSLAIGCTMAALLLYWQYFRRKSTVGIVLIAVTIAAVYAVPVALTRPRAFSIQQRFAHQPGTGRSLVIAPDLARGRFVPGPFSNRNYAGGPFVQFAFPVDFQTGGGLESRVEMVELVLTDADTGAVLPAAPRSSNIAWLEDGKSWLSVGITRPEYERLRNRRLQIAAHASVTLFGNPRAVRIPFRPAPRIQTAATLGACAAQAELPRLMVLCREPFGPRHFLRVALVDRGTGTRSKHQPWIGPGGGYGPLHQDPGLSALTQFGAEFPLVPQRPGDPAPWDLSRLNQTDIEFTSFEPLDHVRRTIRLDGIQLEAFEIVPAANSAVRF